MSNKNGIYKEFNGPMIKTIEELVSEKRIPINISNLMVRRLEFGNSERDFYIDNTFDSVDAVIYHPSSRVKIAIDLNINEIIEKKKITALDGALILNEDLYSSIKGREFELKNLRKENHIGTLLKKEEARQNPIWNILARDIYLLNNYTEFVFSEIKKRFSSDVGMKVNLDLFYYDNLIKMKVWTLGNFFSKSAVFGNLSLSSPFGRLIGKRQ